jgi:hypothetical protein
MPKGWKGPVDLYNLDCSCGKSYRSTERKAFDRYMLLHKKYCADIELASYKRGVTVRCPDAEKGHHQPENPDTILLIADGLLKKVSLKSAIKTKKVSASAPNLPNNF